MGAALLAAAQRQPGGGVIAAAAVAAVAGGGGEPSTTATTEGFLVLCKFRDGPVELVRVPFVPPRAVCRALSGDYKGRDCIQLNIEDE